MNSDKIPQDVRAGLDKLKLDLQKHAGPNLAGLILYGGLARGRYRPGKSDVNVVVLLKEAGADELSALAPVLQPANRSLGVEPLILTLTEVARAADAFPTKFLDIKQHHVVLFGVDPFTNLEVSREHIRLRVEQELRNLSLRLRRAYWRHLGDARMLRKTLTQAARPFALEAIFLLQLSNKRIGADDRSAVVFAAAADAFGFDRPTLTDWASLRQDEEPVSLMEALFGKILTIVSKAADLADQLKEVSA